MVLPAAMRLAGFKSFTVTNTTQGWPAVVTTALQPLRSILLWSEFTYNLTTTIDTCLCVRECIYHGSNFHAYVNMYSERELWSVTKRSILRALFYCRYDSRLAALIVVPPVKFQHNYLNVLYENNARIVQRS